MSTVRQLIEQLAATEEQHQFARRAERFGDDLERAWAESEPGAGLLWLAATVGVAPTQIVASACHLLEGVVDQMNITSQETSQILVAPEVEEVVTAAVWLTNLVGEIPPQTRPDDVLEQGTWDLVDHLAHALVLHQGWGGSDDDPPEGYQHAYTEAMRRFAITIRESITGAQIQTAAHQSGMWPS